MLTKPSPKSELLYMFFNFTDLEEQLPEVAKRHKAVIDKYQLSGYVAYANHNTWYEEKSRRLLGTTDKGPAELGELLIQVNGGFLVSVKKFPTGKRHSFLHRSGAEHKSRTFVLLDFAGEYKPDYGRKNLSTDAHPLVLDLCKALISRAVTEKESLAKRASDSTHGATDTAQAKTVLDQCAEELPDNALVLSGQARFGRAPVNETEVCAQFVSFVLNGSLPGFEIRGLTPSNILDGFFNYHLPNEDKWAINSHPLGVYFPEELPRSYKSKWLEFKLRLDDLIRDFEKKPGEAGKKYFTLTDLLICEGVDFEFDNFTLQEIAVSESSSDDQAPVDDRLFVGATHLLTSGDNREHSIQVICLSTLRDRLRSRPAG